MDYGEGIGNAFELILGDVELEAPSTLKEVRLRKLTLLEMFNFEPSSYFLRNLAWKASFGLINVARTGGYDMAAGEILLGLGKAGPVSLGNRALFYSLATSGLMIFPDPFAWDPFVGLRMGAILSPSLRHKVALDGEFRHFPRLPPLLKADLRHRWLLSPNFGWEQALETGRSNGYRLEYRLGFILHF